MKTAKRTLNVKQVTKKEISEAWNLYPLPPGWTTHMFIRCNAKGEVRWDIAPVYHPRELIKRGNYKIF